MCTIYRDDIFPSLRVRAQHLSRQIFFNIFFLPESAQQWDCLLEGALCRPPPPSGIPCMTTLLCWDRSLWKNTISGQVNICRQVTLQIRALGVSQMHGGIPALSLRNVQTTGLWANYFSETPFPSLLNGMITPTSWSDSEDQQEYL